MKFFNEYVEIAKTQNRLPHWQQEGSTYFVTFRLNDSIPKALMDRWTAERNRWMANHPPPWDKDTEMEYHSLFSAEMDRMLDAGLGECVLRKREFAEIVREELGKYDGVRYILHGYVVMPNHVHLLFSLAEGIALEKVVGGWKRKSARRMNESLEKEGAI